MYSLTTGPYIIRDYDGATIPMDTGNSDYLAYLDWVAAGNTPTPVPPVPLATVQAQVNAQINAKCIDLCLTCPFMGKVVQADVDSKIIILGIVILGAMPATAARWRTLDNTYLPMTYVLYQQLMGAISARIGAAYATSFGHQDNINALTDDASVLAYDWSTGWPT